jgi:hypothetical protein
MSIKKKLQVKIYNFNINLSFIEIDFNKFDFTKYEIAKPKKRNDII